MSLQPKEKLGITAIAVLVAVKFVVVPWFEWVDVKSQQIQQLSKNVKRFERVAEKKAVLETQESKIQESYKQLEKVWESTQSTQASVKIRRHIESTAKKNKVELKNITTGKVNTAETSTMPVSLFLKGTPESVLALINELETGAPKLMVSRANIQRPNAKSATITASLQMLVLMKLQEVENDAS